MRPLAYDIETTGLNLHTGAEMFSYSTCTWEGKTQVSRLDGSVKRIDESFWRLRNLIDRRIPLIMHNAKFDLTGTENFLNIKLPYDYPIHDTIIQSNLIQNNHRTHALKDLGWELAGIRRDDEKAVKKFKTFQSVPEWIMNDYQERDAERTMLLHRFFMPKIKNKYESSYENELKLIRVTMEMERRGIMINKKTCRKIIEQLKIDTNIVLDELERYCGKRVNPHKAADVRWLFYIYEKLPIRALTKITKEASTDKDTMLELRDEFRSTGIEFILKYRSWHRGVKTLTKYLELADNDGIIHPEIKTNGATTGRESCKTPNLQNVAKSKSLLVPYPVMARKVFRPRPGHVFVLVDYAGIELRLLVHYGNDPVMLKEINKPDGDPHALAAKVFYGNKFTGQKLLRDAAKNMNFAISYGGGAAQIAKGLGLYGEEGLRAYQRYQDAFPRQAALHREISSQVKEDGFIVTHFGRLLFVPRDKAYMGTNYLIQGTAAGILKRAQVRVYEWLQYSGLSDIYMLLPVHDEIIFEIPRIYLNDLDEIMRNIAGLMEDFNFKVPMKIEADIATYSWEDKKEYNFRKEEL
jgi:DNA polymerase-1